MVESPPNHNHDFILVSVNSVITIEHLFKQYHTITALNDVSFSISQGATIGVLGPNGAGKSTLFRLIAGLLQPDGGTIRPNAGTWPTISYKPDRLLFPNRLTAYDYLCMVGQLSGVHASQLDNAVQLVLNQVGLQRASNKKIGILSKGMRQRIGIAQSLIGEPDLILLDEPSNGLDPNGQAEMATLIQALRDQGKTILLSSHQLREVTATCTEIIIIQDGQLTYSGSMIDALSMHPTIVVHLNRPVNGWDGQALQRIHPEIEVNADMVVLHNDAMYHRRDVLTLLLNADYDVLRVEQRRNTLAELYEGMVTT